MAIDSDEKRIVFTAVDNFTATMGTLKRSLGDTRSSLDSVKGALAAVGATVGAGAMVALMNDVLKANAALDDMAEKTGASVERLSAMEQVAKIGGHSMDSVAEGAARMIKGLKGADEEGQNAGRALAFLGVQAKDSQGRFRDVGDIMIDVARAMARYEDGGNKVSLVQDLMGRGAAALLPYLKDLAEEGNIQAKLTAEQAAQAEKLEKNMNRLRIVFEDARRDLVVGLTPALVKFTGRLLDAVKATGGLASGLLFAVGGRVGGSPQEVQGQIADIDRRLADLDKATKPETSWRDWARIGNSSRPGSERRVNPLTNIDNQLEIGRLIQRREFLERQLTRMMQDPANFVGPQRPPSALAYESQAQRRGRTEAEQLAERRREMQIRAEQQFADDLQKAGREWAEYQEAQDKERLATFIQVQRDTERALEISLQNQQDLREASDAAWAQAELRKRKDTEEQAARLWEQAQKIKSEQMREAERNAQVARELGLTFSSAFERAVLSGQRLRDVLRGISQDVLAILVRRQITEPLAGGLSGAISSGGLGGLFTSGLDWLMEGWAAGGHAASGITAQNAYLGFAGGGSFTVGGAGGTDSQLVAFRATPGERVSVATPEQQRGQAGPVFQIDARGASLEAVQRLERMVIALNGSLERRAVNAVRGAQMRGALA